MKITMKSYEDLKETLGVTELDYGLKHNDGSFFSNDMKSLCGKEIEVLKIKKTVHYPYDYKEIYEGWGMSEWMIEDEV